MSDTLIDFIFAALQLRYDEKDRGAAEFIASYVPVQQREIPVIDDYIALKLLTSAYCKDQFNNQEDNVGCCTESMKAAFEAIKPYLRVQERESGNGWREFDSLLTSELPDTKFLVLDVDMEVTIVTYCDESNVFYEGENYVPLNWVTHWMPLPVKSNTKIEDGSADA